MTLEERIDMVLESLDIDREERPETAKTIEEMAKMFYAMGRKSVRTKYKDMLTKLMDAIDYSFMMTDHTYDKSLTYPVIDKIRWIKSQL